MSQMLQSICVPVHPVASELANSGVHGTLQLEGLLTNVRHACGAAADGFHRPHVSYPVYHSPKFQLVLLLVHQVVPVLCSITTCALH